MNILYTLATLICLLFLGCSKEKDIPPTLNTTFTVTFESNGGTVISTQTVDDGKKATEPSTLPTKTGEVFDGWFTETALTNAFNFDTPITQNTFLYAKWIPELFNIPDANFRTTLKNLIPNAFNENDKLITTHTDVTSLKEMYFTKKDIGSLEGIQFFTSLEKLYSNQNQLTSLDLSNNRALISLICINEQLTNLNLSNNTALEVLYCSDNQLTNLDLSNNTALEVLYCSNNQLTNLDLSNNTALEVLHCSNNQLTNLDLSNNTALEVLHCSDNQLTNLDLRGMRQKPTTEFNLFDKNDNPLNSIKVHDSFKNNSSIRDSKTDRGNNLKIEVYTADAGSTNYTKTCSDYNPNSDTCITP